MQPVELGEASPVTSVKRIAADQAERHRHVTAILLRDDQTDRLWHPLRQQAEKIAGQIRRLTAHRLGIAVAAVDKIPLRLGHFGPFEPDKFDALRRDLFALFAKLLSFT